MNSQLINNAIEEGKSLQLIAQSYSELSSIKLKAIRADVERNRAFYEELAQVYRTINQIAHSKKVVMAPKAKKKVSILLTSNYRFYGSINTDLTKFFVIESTKSPTDRIVIGSTGQEQLKAINYFHQFKNMHFKQDLPDEAELKSLAEEVASYEQVLVFYSQFQSVLVQKPRVLDLTQSGTQLEQKVKPVTSPESFEQSFILEPDINKMMAFFDHQIKGLLLYELFLESELARTASRLISMDQAQTNAKDYIKDQKKSLSKLKKSTQNKRLLEIISAVSSWGDRKVG